MNIFDFLIAVMDFFVIFVISMSVVGLAGCAVGAVYLLKRVDK